MTIIDGWLRIICSPPAIIAGVKTLRALLYRVLKGTVRKVACRT